MSTQARVILTFHVLLLLTGVGIGCAQEWTRFRGPNGSGVSEATSVPVSWADADYNWRIRLPGGGHSSPVIWGERLFITSADEEKNQRYLLCIDTKDGSTLWQREFAFEPYKKHRTNSFATNTPAVDDRHVYVLWQSQAGSLLHALDHDGNVVWQFDMGAYKSGHGTGSSPIVYDGMVIVCNDHDADSFLVAVDAASGNERWRVKRIGDRACYSTPCVFELEGRDPEIVFTHSYRGITGVDARRGQVKWEIDVFGTHQQRAVASPLIYKDLVIGSSGFTTAEKNVVAVRPTDTPEGPTVREVYRLNKLVPHCPTPVVYRDWLFLLSDTGIATCADAGTGKQIWQQRIGGNFFGSPICIGGRLYAIDVDGVVTVFAAAEEPEIISQAELGETTRATPAASHGVLYLRTYSQLFSLGGKP